MIQPINPPGIPPPLGGLYQHAAKAPSKTLVLVAGQIPVDGSGQVVGTETGRRVDLEAQIRQTYSNVKACLNAAGADFKDLVHTNTYVVDAAFNEYRNVTMRGFVRDCREGATPPGTIVAVTGLMRPGVLIEIEGIAVVETNQSDGSAGPMLEQINPPGVFRPIGSYGHVMKVSARDLVFVAGQIPLDGQGKMVGIGPNRQIDLEAQLRQVYSNIKACLNAAGADYNNVVRMNTYIVATAFNEFRNERFQRIKREYVGDHNAPGAVVSVAALMPPEALVEIEVIAALD